MDARGLRAEGETDAPAESGQKAEGSGSGSAASAMDGQPVNWTMESDCSMCHTSEAASATDAACPQATAPQAEGVACASATPTKGTLSAETHADVKFGDKAASEATVVTVDPETCISCHGTLEDMAAKTADSTALTDDKGHREPHDIPPAKHEENPATCTDCHNNHSKDLPKDARYCAQCHPPGTFECGTCHELRER